MGYILYYNCDTEIRTCIKQKKSPSPMHPIKVALLYLRRHEFGSLNSECRINTQNVQILQTVGHLLYSYNCNV